MWSLREVRLRKSGARVAWYEGRFPLSLVWLYTFVCLSFLFAFAVITGHLLYLLCSYSIHLHIVKDIRLRLCIVCTVYTVYSRTAISFLVSHFVCVISHELSSV